jgi:hypothetical protein
MPTSENTGQKRTKTQNLPSEKTERKTDENTLFAVTLPREMRFRVNYQ